MTRLSPKRLSPKRLVPRFVTSGRVGGTRSKERDRKSELVLGSTYQIFEWDRNNSDRKFDFWETNRMDSGRFGKRRFGKNMAADVSAKKSAESSQAKNICRNISYDMWGKSDVCTLGLTVAKKLSLPKRPVSGVRSRI